MAMKGPGGVRNVAGGERHCHSLYDCDNTRFKMRRISNSMLINNNNNNK